ncbi:MULTISPECIES: hypothetical protein [unclassified Acidovorax]|uniref:hypothetical protein n=1 Tax=unclassified Acidovorax TaxID=2684926 RepID=UPI0012E11310|nr:MULTISPECIES: hypothetical protein [unclassified Acidovorax]
MKINRLTISGLAFLLVAILLILDGFFLKLQSRHLSPHGVYQLDYYQPSLLQRLFHKDLRDPAVVRLYRVEPMELLGESEVVDLSGGVEIAWLLDPPFAFGEVWGAQDAVFHKIPPECTSISKIPSCLEN